jgi:hypothetical protein
VVQVVECLPAQQAQGPELNQDREGGRERRKERERENLTERMFERSLAVGFLLNLRV